MLLSQPLVLSATLLRARRSRSRGFAWTRRWRYGPFFLALVLGGLLVMIAGFPERHAAARAG